MRLAPLSLCLCLASLPGVAGELVYQPVNPNFGGNPLNGSMLLNLAQAQNRHKEVTVAKSQTEQFNETLQRTIMSRVASAIAGKVVDRSGNLVPGELETADFAISIIDLGGGRLKIVTTDKATGQVTEFEIDG